LVVPTELEPLVYPYLQARGVAPDEMLRGIEAAAEYEVWLMRNEGIRLDQELSLEKRLNLLAIGSFGLVAIVVIGNVVQLWQWLVDLRRESSKE
jgi:hypothetical protein